MINDKRKTKRPTLFVLFVDTFLSGWGKAQGGVSYYALAIKDRAEARTVLANGKAQGSLKRGKVVRTLPTLRAGDHLSVADRNVAPTYYKPDGFKA